MKKIPKHLPLFFIRSGPSGLFVIFVINLGFNKFFAHCYDRLDIPEELIVKCCTLGILLRIVLNRLLF